MNMPIQINIDNDKVQAVSMWHPINNKWVLVTQIVGETHKFYTDGIEVMQPSAQQSVQPTAFGVGKRGLFSNLLVRLGKYLIQIGGG